MSFSATISPPPQAPAEAPAWLVAPSTVPESQQRLDAETFAAVVERDRTVAYALAAQICRNRALAEDVVQEALLSAWRDRDRYDPRLGSSRSWLLRIVRNRAIDALRHERSCHRLDVSDDATVARLASHISLEAEAQQRHEADQVRGAVATMPVDQRVALELSFMAGLSHTEIADSLGLSLGTVKGRIRLGLARLRALPEFTLPA